MVWPRGLQKIPHFILSSKSFFFAVKLISTMLCSFIHSNFKQPFWNLTAHGIFCLQPQYLKLIINLPLPPSTNHLADCHIHSNTGCPYPFPSHRRRQENRSYSYSWLPCNSPILSSWRPGFWLHTIHLNRYISLTPSNRCMCQYSRPNLSPLPPSPFMLLSKDL